MANVPASWSTSSETVGVAAEIKAAAVPPPAAPVVASWTTSSETVGVAAEVKAGSVPSNPVSVSWVTSSEAVGVAGEIKQGVPAPPAPAPPTPGATLAQIRQGMAAALGAMSIPGFQINAYALSNMTLPAIVIQPGEVIYHGASQGGAVWWEMRVNAFVQMTADIGNQKTLDQLIGPSGDLSVKDHLEDDNTLGGTVEDLVVVSCSGYGSFTLPSGIPAYGAEWLVRVLAKT